MDSPQSEYFIEASCSNIDKDSPTNVEDLPRRAFVTCMTKFSIYLYLTLRKRGLFNNADKSIEEIARDYQVEMLAKNTIEKQQRRLLSDLLTVEEDPSLEEPIDFTEATQPLVNEPVSSETQHVEQENEPEPEPLQTEREKENLMFMQAMTRLKMFVNSHVSVPRTAVQDLLTPIISLPHPMFGAGTSSLTDSGFGSLNTQQSTMSNASGHIPTREIGNVMRASRCNKILSKSVDAVLARLQTVISKNDVTVYENWEDSVLELSVSTLNQLVECLCLEDEDNEVRKKCSAFIEEAIVDILTFEGMNNRLLSLKYYFIISLVDNIYTCYDAINILFEKLRVFESFAKDPQFNYKIPISTIETSYYIFKMLEALIHYYIYKTKMENKSSDNTNRQTCDERIRGWSNYLDDKSNKHTVDEREVKRNIDHWIKLLERYNVSFTGTFCLHAIKGSEILTNVLQPEL